MEKYKKKKLAHLSLLQLVHCHDQNARIRKFCSLDFSSGKVQKSYYLSSEYHKLSHLIILRFIILVIRDDQYNIILSTEVMILSLQVDVADEMNVSCHLPCLI
jgi:hypothetical protein